VARQATALLHSFNYEAVVMPNELHPAMKLYLNGSHVADIIEGCNAVSIIILFISFVLAFYQNLKKTLLFILAGSVLIYCVNVARIAFLTVALYKYPEHQEVLHSVVFPAIIYGMVFLLWVFWIRSIKPTAHA